MGSESASGIKDFLSERLSVKSLGKGIVFGYLMVVILITVFSYVLSLTNFPSKYTSAVTIIVTIISVIITGMIASGSARTKGWLNGIIAGFLYFAVLYILSMLVFDSYKFNMSAFSNLVTCLVSGALGGILGINFNKPQKVKYKRM